MLGAIIGDIVGSIYEFNNTQDKHFPLFSDECSITDDSICTVALADAILHGHLYAVSLWKWCRNYPNPMGGYGGSFVRWLHKDFVDAPYNSFGNGAAMRISAIGAAFDTDAEVIREAFEATHITHSHAEGIIGATAVALAISNYKRDKFFAEEHNLLDSIACKYYGEQWKRQIPQQGQFDETCQRCVPLAFKIVSESSSFVDAIRRAVLYGGDTDTVAAIVGSIAEERFGIEQQTVREAARFIPSEMKAVIKEFYYKFYDAAHYRYISKYF